MHDITVNRWGGREVNVMAEAKDKTSLQLVLRSRGTFLVSTGMTYTYQREETGQEG